MATTRHYSTGNRVPYCKATGYSNPYKPTVRDFITNTLDEVTCNECYKQLLIKKLKVDIKLGVVKPSQLTNLVPKERALTVSKEYTSYKIETQQSRVLYNLEKNIKPIINGDNRPIF